MSGVVRIQGLEPPTHIISISAIPVSDQIAWRPRSANASTICCPTHPDVRNTSKTRSRIVGTVKKSTDTI
jgi:hypothetical protein